MKNKIEKFLLSPSYLVLLSIYPVLPLYSTNTYQVSFWVLFRPLIISALLSSLIFLILNLVLADRHKTAFVTTLIIAFFFTFGHIENFLESKNIQGASYYIFAGWLGIVLLIKLLDTKLKNGLIYSGFAPSINLMAIILLLYPLGKGIQYTIVQNKSSSSKPADIQQLNISRPETAPDIYYIILDGYARSDVLEEAYKYDNSEFIDSLESMGFYIAECSQSNYPNTSLSLTSSLNMNYIQNLDEHFTPDERELFYMFSRLKNNSLKEIFETAGYKTIAFASGFSWAEMQEFDVFLSPPSGAVNEFEVMFLKTTFIQYLDNHGFINLDNITAERYRERTRLVFDSFLDIAKMPGPKFVFMHIIAPHPPFGFDENGNSVFPNEVDDRDGYVNQAKFAGRQVAESAEILISQSAIPPIIIIQGDHGLWSARQYWRLGILNAYYLPGHTENLYPSITPVNTFRLIFNEYFETDYQLLPDNSYDTNLPYIYKFDPVENNCKR